MVNPKNQFNCTNQSTLFLLFGAWLLLTLSVHSDGKFTANKQEMGAKNSESTSKYYFREPETEKDISNTHLIKKNTDDKNKYINESTLHGSPIVSQQATRARVSPQIKTVSKGILDSSSQNSFDNPIKRQKVADELTPNSQVNNPGDQQKTKIIRLQMNSFTYETRKHFLTKKYQMKTGTTCQVFTTEGVPLTCGDHDCLCHGDKIIDVKPGSEFSIKLEYNEKIISTSPPISMPRLVTLEEPQIGLSSLLYHTKFFQEGVFTCFSTAPAVSEKDGQTSKEDDRNITPSECVACVVEITSQEKCCTGSEVVRSYSGSGNSACGCGLIGEIDKSSDGLKFGTQYHLNFCDKDGFQIATKVIRTAELPRNVEIKFEKSYVEYKMYFLKDTSPYKCIPRFKDHSGAVSCVGNCDCSQGMITITEEVISEGKNLVLEITDNQGSIIVTSRANGNTVENSPRLYYYNFSVKAVNEDDDSISYQIETDDPFLKANEAVKCNFKNRATSQLYRCKKEDNDDVECNCLSGKIVDFIAYEDQLVLELLIQDDVLLSRIDLSGEESILAMIEEDDEDNDDGEEDEIEDGEDNDDEEEDGIEDGEDNDDGEGDEIEDGEEDETEDEEEDNENADDEEGIDEKEDGEEDGDASDDGDDKLEIDDAIDNPEIEAGSEIEIPDPVIDIKEDLECTDDCEIDPNKEAPTNIDISTSKVPTIVENDSVDDKTKTPSSDGSVIDSDSKNKDNTEKTVNGTISNIDTNKNRIEGNNDADSTSNPLIVIVCSTVAVIALVSIIAIIVVSKYLTDNKPNSKASYM